MKIADSLVCGTLGAILNMTMGRFPAVVRVETTNNCNARCRICPHLEMTRPVTVMDEDLYRSIIDECAANKCHTVHLHNFGEPLLDKALPERISYAKHKGIGKVKIFSNGSLLSGETATRLLQSGLDEIKISLDGRDKEEFESIRVGLNYDKVVSNIHKFIQMRASKGLKSPRVVASCCTTSDRSRSEDNLKDVVDKYSFGRLHNWAGHSEARPGSIRKPCSRVWRTFTILANGDVALCCLDYDGKVVLGNMKKDGSITRIWKNARYAKMRHLHSTGAQGLIGICDNCSKSFV